MTNTFQIRTARDDDEAFILGLASRFADCDIPPWRTPLEIEAGTRRWIEAALRERAETSWIGVAVSGLGERVGFVFAHEREDFFTGARLGHVSDIAVTPEAESTGAAEALMEAAARWARARGYERLGLNVFAGNTRARRFYERLGFSAETLAYSRSLE